MDALCCPSSSGKGREEVFEECLLGRLEGTLLRTGSKSLAHIQYIKYELALFTDFLITVKAELRSLFPFQLAINHFQPLMNFSLINE